MPTGLGPLSALEWGALLTRTSLLASVRPTCPSGSKSPTDCSRTTGRWSAGAHYVIRGSSRKSRSQLFEGHLASPVDEKERDHALKPLRALTPLLHSGG